MRNTLVPTLVAIAALAGCSSDSSAGSAGVVEAADAPIHEPASVKTSKQPEPKLEPTQEDLAAVRKFIEAPDRSEMVLPTPSMVLAGVAAATGPDGKVRLSKHIVRMSGPRDATPQQLAMRAGILITDFFVYVHERDASKADELMEELVRLADQLKVGPETKTSARELHDALGARDWATARQTLDEIHAQLAPKASETPSESDAEVRLYVLIGGWVEAVHLLTAELDQSYDASLAEILQQAVVAQHLSAQLATRGRATGLENVRVQLDALAKALAAHAPPAEEDVDTVLQLTAGLRSAV